jgi:hypothetical protein
MIKPILHLQDLQEADLRIKPRPGRARDESIEALICRLRELLSDPMPSSGDFDRWEDKEYIYLESTINEAEGPVLDVTVYKGRVFVRAERWA